MVSRSNPFLRAILTAAYWVDEPNALMPTRLPFIPAEVWKPAANTGALVITASDFKPRLLVHGDPDQFQVAVSTGVVDAGRETEESHVQITRDHARGDKGRIVEVDDLRAQAFGFEQSLFGRYVDACDAHGTGVQTNSDLLQVGGDRGSRRHRQGTRQAEHGQSPHHFVSSCYRYRLELAHLQRSSRLSIAVIARPSESPIRAITTTPAMT